MSCSIIYFFPPYNRLQIQFLLILHDFFSKTNRFTNLYAKLLRKENLEPNSSVERFGVIPIQIFLIIIILYQIF